MQKSMKKFISFLMAIILAVPLLGITAPVMEVKADNGFDVSRYNLEWTTPSVKQDDSMPLGNGEVGLNLWMENERDLVFYISRVGAYADNSTTMKLGRIRITFPEGQLSEYGFKLGKTIPSLYGTAFAISILEILVTIGLLSQKRRDKYK